MSVGSVAASSLGLPEWRCLGHPPHGTPGESEPRGWESAMKVIEAGP